MIATDDLKENPYRYNFYQLLRQLERESPHKPRIGDSQTLGEEVVILGQDPYVAFASANVSGYSVTPLGTPRLQTRFLGMFGPQGPLPLHLTEEAYQWFSRDPAFTRFVDIFTTRFLQLFYRAWADARPIAQFEHPERDRFYGFLGSFEGIATPAMRQADSVEDLAKIPFAGLANIQVKSARGLEQFLRGLFGLDLEIHQWIGTWLKFEEAEMMQLGTPRATIGSNAFLGARVHSISERIRIRIRCRDREHYESLLPGSRQAQQLADAVFFFCGYRYDVEVELGIEAKKAPRMRLGREGRLGWTSWSGTKSAVAQEVYYFDARFDPMLRRGGKT